MKKYGLIKDNTCVSLMESENQKTAQKAAKTIGCDAVELQDGYGIGSKYIDGKWSDPLPKPTEPTDPTEPTIEERLELIEMALDDLIMNS